MAKVLEFPVKKQLSQEVENILHLIAHAYIDVMNYALSDLSSEHPTDEELNEIRNLVELCYAKGLIRAIDEMEEP